MAKTIFDSVQTAYDVLHTCDPQKTTCDPVKQHMLDEMQTALQNYVVSPSRVHLFSLDEIALAQTFVDDVAPMKQKYDHAHENDHYMEKPRQSTGRHGEIAVEGMIDRDFCDFRVGEQSKEFDNPDLFPLLPVGVKTAEFPKSWLIDRKYMNAKKRIAESGLTPAEYMRTLKTDRNTYPLVPQILVMLSPDAGHERAVVFGLVPVSELVKNADDRYVMNKRALNGKTGFSAFNTAIPFHDWDSLVAAFNKAVDIDRAAGFDVYSDWMKDPEREASISVRRNAVIDMDEHGNPTFEEFGEPQPYTSDDICSIRLPDSVRDRANAKVAAWTCESGGFGGATACYESQRQALVANNSRSFASHMTNALRNGHDPFASENLRDREARAAVSSLYSVFRHTDFGEFCDRVQAICRQAVREHNDLLAIYLADDDRITHICSVFQEREAEEVNRRRETHGLPTVDERIDQLREMYPQAFEPMSDAVARSLGSAFGLDEQDTDQISDEDAARDDWDLSL